ncbi:CTP synthase [Nematocida sp. LUAm3]|nr:CTP synthase [Nematocida sp. LUAm3]KAI5173574.1 CTP synthase [Nematocida sp. LUAm2]KAI5176795.1 CTP synthase [Nematocida sp. LUAm1]
MKYILVCGGVISGVGKGVVTSSIGRILKEEGHRVTIIKIDPYLNYDAGTLGPRDHGEVFVLEDGTETDLDLGNYERFLGLNLTQKNSITSGRMYHEVVQKERKGEYLGKTVQVVPHVTDHIKSSIRDAAQVSIDGSSNIPNLCIIELGGVVGDIESITFIEALRQMICEEGKKSFLVVGVDYALELNREHKTKPIQASAKRARELGIPYDAVVCRSSSAINPEAIEKVLLFTGVDKIIELPDGVVLEVPSKLREEGVLEYLQEKLSLPQREALPEKEKYFRRIIEKKSRACKVAIVGKYSNHEDAYLSIKESLKFAGSVEQLDVEVNVTYFDTSYFTEESLCSLDAYDGVIIPGGFGKRGVEQMILVAEHLRKKKIPCLGICLGMQVIAIEYVRNVLGYKNATSEELLIEEDLHTIIDDKIHLETVENHVKDEVLLAISRNEGPMRIGTHRTYSVPGTRLEEIYGGSVEIWERFRHKYGLNLSLAEELEGKGLRIGLRSGEYVDGLESVQHPFYVGVQFHPEFRSKPMEPQPLFVAFLGATLKR